MHFLFGSSCPPGPVTARTVQHLQEQRRCSWYRRKKEIDQSRHQGAECRSEGRRGVFLRGKQPVLTTTYEKTGKVQRDSYYYPNRKKKKGWDLALGTKDQSELQCRVACYHQNRREKGRQTEIQGIIRRQKDRLVQHKGRRHHRSIQDLLLLHEAPETWLHRSQACEIAHWILNYAVETIMRVSVN